MSKILIIGGGAAGIPGVPDAGSGKKVPGTV